MKQNIWILNHYAGNMYFDKGGRHYAFAKYLKKQGYNPVVFCANSTHNAEGYWFDEAGLWHVHYAEEIEVPFVYIAARCYANNGKQRILNMLDFYFNVKKTAKEYAKKHGVPDIIFASSVHPLTLVAGIQLAKYFGVKCVCEVRDLWPESIVVYSGRLNRENPIIKLLYQGEKWIYKKADALVFTMEGAYDYIEEQGWEKDIPREKVHYINNGVDIELFRYNRDHFFIEDADLGNPNIFKVVYAGSIRKVNNLGMLLDAAKQVNDPRVKFLIWGDGDERADLEKLVEKEHIQNVEFKGYVEKQYIPYIISCADLNIAHCESTDVDRFGVSFNKMFEYMAAEKPILSDFPCPYNPAVQHGAGSSVDKPSAENIAAVIEQYSKMDDEQYQKYVRAAGAAAEVFDFQSLTRDLLTIIQDV